MSRVPRIRFKGFEEDWEQRKLGEIAERIIRKNEKLESTLPLTISAQYGLIDQNEFFDKRIASKDVRDYYLIKKGEFAYNKSTSVDAPLGAIKRLDKYKNGVLSTLYILFKIIDDTSTSSDYLVTYYATDLWHRGIQSIAAEGARNHGLLNIAPNDFFETILSIPLNVSEQKKVGDFFISLNHLITLHQRKLEKLKIIKKSMLEKLFPQNGEKTPKIRFSGFTKDWEQCKLGEMCSLITKGTTPLDKSSVGTINFVKIESIDEASGEIKITQKITDEEHNSYLRRSQLKENDILFSIAGTLGRVTSVKLDILPANTNQALAIIRLKSGCLQYIKTYLKGKAVADFIKKNPTIGAQPNLSLEQVGNLEIALPTEKEQALVGAYFESLDNLITLHQSKLEKLQKVKKSMLESMFV